MNHLISSVRQSIQNSNWYAALTLALTLPDIAGKIDYPKVLGGRRYEDWYDNYMLDKYQSEVGAERKTHTFLSGPDCYALRCAFLHEGTFNITNQKAQKVLNDFMFIGGVPRVHRNQVNQTLQLSVEVFCEDICQSIEKWQTIISKDTTKVSALANLLEIIAIDTNAGQFKIVI